MPIVVGNLEEWRDRIVEKATELATAEEKKRSVLIICESINDADYLHLGFVSTANKKRNSSTLPVDHVHVYKRSYEKFSILSSSDKIQEDKELDPGHVIISTNLAGRGTDIKISDELNRNGGICVILSYLPNNIRVEQQAFGRAARKGQNGSGILIVRNRAPPPTQTLLSPDPAHTPINMISTTNIFDEVTMVDLKNDRDEAEIFAMSRIEADFASLIGYEEALFWHFGKHYQRIKPKIMELYNKTAILDVVLACLIDKWAFWLDKAVAQRLPYEDAIASLDQLMSNNKKHWTKFCLFLNLNSLNYL